MAPTLLRKGFLVPKASASASERARLREQVPIEFILDALGPWTPGPRAKPPKNQAQRLGDKVWILRSSTGSGKSTVLPYRLFREFGARTGRNIVVTQPRVLTTIDIASSLPEVSPGLKLDLNLGYSTGAFKRLPREKGIIYCTTGTLTEQLLRTPAEQFMKKYAFVLLDEVHDRTLEMDTCLLLLKQLLQAHFKSPDCPIVLLMSATIDPAMYQAYFGLAADHFIEVEGQTYEKIERPLPLAVTDYMEYAAVLAEKIHLEETGDLVPGEPFRDILIFVHTSKAVHELALQFHRLNTRLYHRTNATASALDGALDRMHDRSDVDGGVRGGGQRRTPEGPAYVQPVELTSLSFNQGGAEYKALFSDLEALRVPVWDKEEAAGSFRQRPAFFAVPTRRIIVCTNIAETGVTIDSLRHCIDTGYVLAAEFNPDLDCTLILEKSVTQDMAIQRKGRVGRKAPGKWYPLFTRRAFETMHPVQLPAIVSGDPSAFLLTLLVREQQAEAVPVPKKQAGGWTRFALNDPTRYTLKQTPARNLRQLDFLELPGAEALNYACHKLVALGYLRPSFEVTPFAFYSLPIRFMSLECKRMVFAGFHYGVPIRRLIELACLIEVGGRKLRASSSRNPLRVPPFLPDQEYLFGQGIQDTFIEALCILELFKEKTATLVSSVYRSKLHEKASAVPPRRSPQQILRDWCGKHELQYEGLQQVCQKRDEYLAMFLEAGLNAHYAGASSGATDRFLVQVLRESWDEGLKAIRAIKCCIRDGFGLKALQWSPERNTYTSVVRQVPVRVALPWNTDPRPQRLITHQFMVRTVPTSYNQVRASEFLCVLDQHIAYDNRAYQ